MRARARAMKGRAASGGLGDDDVATMEDVGAIYRVIAISSQSRE
jgi:hypothetical protein